MQPLREMTESEMNASAVSRQAAHSSRSLPQPNITVTEFVNNFASVTASNTDVYKIKHDFENAWQALRYMVVEPQFANAMRVAIEEFWVASLYLGVHGLYGCTVPEFLQRFHCPEDTVVQPKMMLLSTIMSGWPASLYRDMMYFQEGSLVFPIRATHEILFSLKEVRAYGTHFEWFRSTLHGFLVGYRPPVNHSDPTYVRRGWFITANDLVEYRRTIGILNRAGDMSMPIAPGHIMHGMQASGQSLQVANAAGHSTHRETSHETQPSQVPTASTTMLPMESTGILRTQSAPESVTDTAAHHRASDKETDGVVEAEAEHFGGSHKRKASPTASVGGSAPKRQNSYKLPPCSSCKLLKRGCDRIRPSCNRCISTSKACVYPDDSATAGSEQGDFDRVSQPACEHDHETSESPSSAMIATTEHKSEAQDGQVKQQGFGYGKEKVGGSSSQKVSGNGNDYDMFAGTKYELVISMIKAACGDIVKLRDESLKGKNIGLDHELSQSGALASAMGGDGKAEEDNDPTMKLVGEITAFHKFQEMVARIGKDISFEGFLHSV